LTADATDATSCHAGCHNDVADVALRPVKISLRANKTLQEVSMPDDAKLLPPISQINERLTVLSREQRRLRTLLALAVEAKTDAEIHGSTYPSLESVDGGKAVAQ